MSHSKDQDGKIERRDVLKLGTAAAAGFVAKSVMGETPRKIPDLPQNPATPDAMPTRNLGKTGYQVGIFSLGGQAAIEQADNFDVAVPLIEKALDLGVNYVDTSARYGGVENRWSEQYFGEVMKNRRSEAYLATKSHDRTRDGSLKLLEKSLELLKTDYIDLWQMHALSRPGSGRGGLCQGRCHRGIRRGERSGDRPQPRHLGPRRPRRSDRCHRALPVRLRPAGAQRR